MSHPSPRYDDLRALFINCTLKRSPELSHTQGLVDVSAAHHAPSTASQVDVLRAVDHDIATGVWPDMTEHGWATDEWPAHLPSRCWPPTSWCSPGRSGWATTAR